MSREKLVSFLETLHKDLTRKDATEAYRNQTANKLTHTVSITKAKVNRTIRVTLEKASNVPGTGDALFKSIKTEYDAALNTLFDDIRKNFKTLSNKKGDTVKFVRGSRSGNIKVIIFETPGGRGTRDNFALAQKAYNDPLQKFYETFLKLIDRTLTRPSSSNKEGKVDLKKAGQVFNLEHFKNSSNVKAFISDSIHTALNAHYTKDEYAALQADLKKLGLKTKLEITKNAKTGEIKVFLGSQILNVAQSSEEQKVKKDLEGALLKALKRLGSDKLIELQGSASIYEYKEQKLLRGVLVPFQGIEGVKVSKDKKVTKKLKVKGKGKKQINPKITNSGAIASKLRKKRIRGGSGQARKTSPASQTLQIIARMNKDLPRVVEKNMGSPGLESQTGRFAASTKVTEVIQTPKGFPSIGYTYQRDPYQVFEEGSRGNWSNGYRDPRDLIDKSIREIAAELAIGRLYTRRV